MPKADKKTMLGLEKRYWEAVRNHDGDTAAKLTNDKCILVAADGIKEVTRDEARDMMRDTSFELEYGFDDKQAKVLAVSDDVAIVSYPVHELMSTTGEPAKRLDMFDTTVWVRRNGGWVAALHTETPAEARAA